MSFHSRRKHRIAKAVARKNRKGVKKILARAVRRAIGGTRVA